MASSWAAMRSCSLNDVDCMVLSLYFGEYDALDAVQILYGPGDGAVEALFQQRQHIPGLARAHLQVNRPAGVQMRPGVLRDAAVEVQPVRPPSSASRGSNCTSR